MMFTNVKTGLKDTYLTASVSRCCSGLALFLDGAALFLQRCYTEKRCGDTYVFGCLRLQVRLLERAFFGHVRPHRWNVHVPAAHMPKNFEHPAPSQFSMLIAGSVSFESLIFSTFHTLFLKNYIYTGSTSPILHYLSSRTYPPEP